jgi:DNA polymerase I
MRVVIDIETNGAINPTKIWVICCLDIDNNILYTFRKVTEDETEKRRFLEFASRVTCWIGHNSLGFDFPILKLLIDYSIPSVVTPYCFDTFVISKLSNFTRKSHSLESYGEELNFPKNLFDDWSRHSPELEARCGTDVQLCHRVYELLYRDYISNSRNKSGIDTKQRIQCICNTISSNGFAFDRDKATKLLNKVTKELEELDDDIGRSFPPRLHQLREVTPTPTKYGTLNKKDFRWVANGDLSEFNGGPFSRCEWRQFNPNSHKQIISVLTSAGWSPTDKTKGHIEASRTNDSVALNRLSSTGWKINETNLSTLPTNAPAPARALARRILLESRRRTLVEWIGLSIQGVTSPRIHGKFIAIGAWTHRLSHQKPNMANIPNSLNLDGQVKLLGSEMRSLFIAPKGRLLVGVDAEGIQLRVFAHYINEPEFTRALIEGRKEDKTDVHSLNQRILGNVCKTRASAKRFIYALLLGAGLGKLSEILGCSKSETEASLARLSERYAGFARLKKDVIPRDARRGWFVGLDGRRVNIPGDEQGERRHLAMSGYLQNGENVIMDLATIKWLDKIKLIFPEENDIKLVNYVHDEWQTEVPNDLYIARHVAELQCESLREVGVELKLNCPLAGSYGDNHYDQKTWTIGNNWKVTH